MLGSRPISASSRRVDGATFLRYVPMRSVNVRQLKNNPSEALRSAVEAPRSCRRKGRPRDPRGMAAVLVLTDASPLVGLSRVGGVDWLRELFGTVAMTRTVRSEIEGGGLEPQIVAVLDQGWLRTNPDHPELGERPSHLGSGEWSTIVAAREHRGPVLVLLDDRLARREALAAGLTIAGAAAIVGLARRQGIVESARDTFEQLLHSDFRMAPDVVRAVLEQTEPSADTGRDESDEGSRANPRWRGPRPPDPAPARSRC